MGYVHKLCDVLLVCASYPFFHFTYYSSQMNQRQHMSTVTAHKKTNYFSYQVFYNVREVSESGG